MPRQSSLSGDRRDNDMIPGAVHRPPGIYLGKLQLGDRLMKAVIASNEVPYLQVTSIGSHSISGREKEGKDGTGKKEGEAF